MFKLRSQKQVAAPSSTMEKLPRLISDHTMLFGFASGYACSRTSQRMVEAVALTNLGWFRSKM